MNNKEDVSVSVTHFSFSPEFDEKGKKIKRYYLIKISNLKTRQVKALHVDKDLFNGNIEQLFFLTEEIIETYRKSYENKYQDMALEDLINLLPGRNKYWSNKLPENKWSNDYWCNIDFGWKKDEHGKLCNSFIINYFGDAPNVKLLDEPIIDFPKQAVIKMLETLEKMQLLPYENKED